MWAETVLILLSGFSVLGIMYAAEVIAAAVVRKNKTEKVIILQENENISCLLEEIIDIRRRIGDGTIYVCEEKLQQRETPFHIDGVVFCNADELEKMIKKHFCLQKKGHAI